MKRFDKFTEDVDKVAALKARQRDAVSKFKQVLKHQLPKNLRVEFTPVMLQLRI